MGAAFISYARNWSVTGKMVIQIRSKPTDRLIELGGGAQPLIRPNCDVRQCFDAQGNPTVDFTADFEQPLPIQSEEFDGVLCRYCLEHLTYTKIPAFLREVFRIMKPGGRAAFITPNTDAQFRWAKEHPDGWDGKGYFQAISELLFGSQDYEENSHKAFLTPGIVIRLMTEAGFEQVKTTPYGERDTDMVIEVVKPVEPHEVNVVQGGLQLVYSGQIPEIDRPGPNLLGSHVHQAEFLGRTTPAQDERLMESIASATGTTEKLLTETIDKVEKENAVVAGVVERIATVAAILPVAGTPSQDSPATLLGRPVVIDPNLPNITGEIILGDLSQYDRRNPSNQRAEWFGKDYFNGGKIRGGYAHEGYWDYPVHEVTTQHILARRPESVLEVGCARGYILKKLQDQGVRVCGLEISQHCYLTRVCDDVFLHDLCQTPWPVPDQSYDLCFSIATLEHVPEQYLPAVIGEMARTCKRALHGIDFGQHDDGFDKTHCTLRPREFWVEQFQKYFQVYSPAPFVILDKEDLERGEILPEILQGDGKIKLNVGSYTTMYHRGWHNIDIHNLIQFAQQHRYNFVHCDVRGGLPYQTGTVDLIMLCHFLEHLDYKQGLTFLRECRRVLKPEGAARIIVPDSGKLCMMYMNHLCHTPGTIRGVPEADIKGLHTFDEINDEAAACPTAAGKLWSLLFAGHSCMYDTETLVHSLEQAGFQAKPTHFRKTGFPHPGCEQILRESLDMHPALSLFVDAIPNLG